MITLYEKVESIFKYQTEEVKIKQVKTITILEDSKIIIEFDKRSYLSCYVIRVKLENENIMVASGGSSNEKIIINGKWEAYIETLYQNSLTQKQTEITATNDNLSEIETIRAAKLQELKIKIDKIF